MSLSTLNFTNNEMVSYCIHVNAVFILTSSWFHDFGKNETHLSCFHHEHADITLFSCYSILSTLHSISMTSIWYHWPPNNYMMNSCWTFRGRNVSYGNWNQCNNKKTHLRPKKAIISFLYKTLNKISWEFEILSIESF